MKKLSLNLDALTVESFATALPAAYRGTVDGNAVDTVAIAIGGVQRPPVVEATGLNDTNCSAIDACVSARGCTVISCPPATAKCNTYDPSVCPSVIDACPTRINCTPVYPC